MPRKEPSPGRRGKQFHQIMNKALGLNIGGKIAIARCGEHISVAVFFGIGLLHLNEMAVGLGHRVIYRSDAGAEENRMNHNIAIDGPSGAGKSTLARKTAQKLGYLYLDTGAMYRAFGLYAIRRGIDFSLPDAENTEKIKLLAETFSIGISYEQGAQQVFVAGENVTALIRTPEVSLAASKVAVVPEVRLRLVALQRKIAAEHNVVMDGRDIGSYVLKDAGVKIFLTASAEVRAGRRLKELREKGNRKITFEEVLRDLQFRDENDSSRAFAPLVRAEDAVLLDTSALSEEESEEALLAIIRNKFDGEQNGIPESPV